MIRNSVMFGGLGKTGDNGDDEAPTDSGRRQRRRSSIRVQAFFCSLRRLCDGLQQQARQTTSATRSGSKSDIARSKSTENLVAESEEGCGDSKSVHSPSPSAANKRRRLGARNVNHEAWLHSSNVADVARETHAAADVGHPVLSPSTRLHLDTAADLHLDAISETAASASNAQQQTSAEQQQLDAPPPGTTGPPLTPAPSTYNAAAFMPAPAAAVERGQQQHSQHGQQQASVSGFSPEMLMDPLLAQASALPSPDDYASNPTFLASQEELRSLLFNTAQSNHPTRAPSPAGAGSGAGYADDIIDGGAGSSSSSGQNQMKQILGSRKRIEYLKNYIAKVAPWLDMFDASRHFGINVPALAQTQPPLLFAILALSARHMERRNGGTLRRGHGKHLYPAATPSCESLELYQEAIRLLTPKLPERSPHILTCCVILCCLEMMSASPQDWRRHLEGCATLFDSFDVNGFSGGLLQAVFWCYVRMDLCGALISDGTESTLLALRKWVPSDVAEDEVHDLFAAHRTPDMHANYAVYLCSKVCELLSDRTKYTELGVENGCTGPVYALRWKRLWHELTLWHDERPGELLPVKTIRQKSDRPFPEILFVHWAAISSNQLFHTASILLLNSAPQSLRLPPLPQNNPLWHARRVCGISLSNPHEGCLNNACQPLWIAGRMLGHHSEHSAIIELIRSIEAQTGWGMYWRIRDLEEAWGYRTR
ncbi:c6 transcription factor [Neofusicoccum parvum]|uniref:C6 transcription factor n=1 Tax=Neofusicoccum parvum TaxID=310453 RepID=A0ACB5SMV9_9PEZI|nr:c6 transcription factor [Neofusicoccum parvum]